MVNHTTTLLIQDGFRPLAVIDPSRTAPAAIDLRPHQDRAVTSLNGAFTQAKQGGQSFRGMLVLPTGAGKTLTAVMWLLRYVMPEGFRVLWVAHQHFLLEQASTTFQTMSGHLRDRRSRLRIRTVSGSHNPMTSIGSDDDVVVCGIQSLSRRMDKLEHELRRKGRPWLVVLDEAHHAPANTYTKLLRMVQRTGRGGQYFLLGLTATPTRMSDKEKTLLSSLFGGNIFHQETYGDLIKEGILARPHPEKILTQISFEGDFNEGDMRHFQKMKELSPRMLERIGASVRRNRMIVEAWMAERRKWGKTLIFATDIIHAVTLTKMLGDAGVKAEYVAADRDDGKDNYAIMRDFKNPTSSIEVLVNIRMCTEGVDFPDIQTVFLTRPTRSETLMLQMVGRGLRGPQQGGTKDAHLVAFIDLWARFEGWLDPKQLLPAMDVEEYNPPPPPVPIASGKIEIPWALIHAISQAVNQKASFQLSRFEGLPVGWYTMIPRDGEVESKNIVVVFAHQESGFQGMQEELKQGKFPAPGSPIGDIQDQYFADLPSPLPSLKQLELMARHIWQTGMFPVFTSYQERDRIDPTRLAQMIVAGKLDFATQMGLIKTHFDDVAQQVYPDIQAYKTEVDRAVTQIMFPLPDRLRMEGAEIAWDETPLPRLAPPPPGHDLDAILQDLARDVRLFPKGTYLPRTIRWSNRILKRSFGYYDRERNIIVINRILQSPEVSANTMRFLVYHELIHCRYDLMDHGKEFRALEHKFPGYLDAETELDTLMERFQWKAPAATMEDRLSA